MLSRIFTIIRYIKQAAQLWSRYSMLLWEVTTCLLYPTWLIHTQKTCPEEYLRLKLIKNPKCFIIIWGIVFLRSKSINHIDYCLYYFIKCDFIGLIFLIYLYLFFLRLPQRMLAWCTISLGSMLTMIRLSPHIWYRTIQNL